MITTDNQAAPNVPFRWSADIGISKNNATNRPAELQFRLVEPPPGKNKDGVI